MAGNVFDLVIIGGGAAGFSAATVAAENGFSVAMVSDGPLGGTCANFGCIPTKAMLLELSKARLSGAHLRLPEVLKRARGVAAGIRASKYEDLASELGITVFRGRAKLNGGRQIRITGGEVIEYRKALILAVGSKTVWPNVEGLSQASDMVYDNETILGLEFQPERALVVGGGPQGIEFSQIMARSGVGVTLLHRRGRLLAREEPEAGAFAREVLEDEGVEVLARARLLRFYRRGAKVVAEASVAGEKKVIETDMVFLATGRKPRLEGLGLDMLGVKVGHDGFIKVDSRMQAAPGVYAAGDCTGPPMLEPVAAKEGYIAAVNALGIGEASMDYTAVPRAVFIEPEIASVGMTEAELAKKLGVCACRTVPLELVPRAAIEGVTRGFAKVVVDPRDRSVVGVTLAGPRAAEAVQEAVYIVKGRMKLEEVIDTVHIFPTINEAIKYAALAFTRDVSRMPCCLV